MSANNANVDADYDPDKGLPNPDSQEVKDTGNVIGGYKASLANSGHSDEAKQNDKEQLQKLEEQGAQGFNTANE